MRRRTFLGGAAAAFLSACGGATHKSGPTATTAPAGTTASAPATSAPAVTTAPAPTLAPGAPAAFVARRAGDAPQVALTFHTDGDLRIDQRLLDAVGTRAQITCFVVGAWLDANPTWARKLLDAGHELANHTYNHLAFASLSRADMASEITRCRDTLTRLTGKGGRFFRPSGTDDGLAVPSSAILEEAGKAGYDYVLGWDVDPFDYRDPGGTAVRTRVLDAIKPGSIVSMHFGHSGTADAMSAILDGLDHAGLRPVTASALLGV